MQERTLKADSRSVTGKQVSRLRRAGRLPGVLYGRGTEPTAIELDAVAAGRVLEVASASTLLDLELNGESHKVLVRELQRHPLHRTLDHVDLMKVAMDVIIRAEVPIELTGEAPAVKTLGGVLVTGLSEIEVEALPADLPSRVAVDLETLTAIDSRISVGDLFFGKGVKVLTDPNVTVARVIYQVEEQLEEPAAVPEAAVEEPEIIGRGKREEEEEEGEEEGAPRKEGGARKEPAAKKKED